MVSRRIKAGSVGLALAALVAAAWWAPGSPTEPPKPAATLGRVLEPPRLASPAAPAPAPAATEPAWVLLALQRAPGGAPYAQLRVGSAPARAVRPGDSLGPGLRLSRILQREVEIERGTRRERLALPAGVPGLPPPPSLPPAPRLDEPLGPIARPADAGPPSSTGLERAIHRAAAGG